MEGKIDALLKELSNKYMEHPESWTIISENPIFNGIVDKKGFARGLEKDDYMEVRCFDNDVIDAKVTVHGIRKGNPALFSEIRDKIIETIGLDGHTTVPDMLGSDTSNKMIALDFAKYLKSRCLISFDEDNVVKSKVELTYKGLEKYKELKRFQTGENSARNKLSLFK